MRCWVGSAFVCELGLEFAWSIERLKQAQKRKQAMAVAVARVLRGWRAVDRESR